MAMHWADKLAGEIVERAKREGGKANIKCQQTPSGGKHIGNLNDVVRAYYPYKAVLERNEVECEFVHTSDNRDPFGKGIPCKIADLDGKWHPSAEFDDFSQYTGMPLCRVPDPFGCCESWSRHFTKVWTRGLEELEIKPKMFFLDDLYKSGKMEKYVKMTFEKSERAGKIISDFQESKGEDHIPFDGICPKCGRLSNAVGFDLKKKTAKIACGGKRIKDRKSGGCGFEGEVPWSEGKLQWRFEWAALWALFNTTFEPFGKDHAEGSWKSGKVICREVFEQEPPIPFVYEFFLVNNEKMSASQGNVYIVQDMTKIMEPEVFKMFYATRPEKQRNLDLKHAPMMVHEFDEMEAVYFGKSEARTENREENAKRIYELCMEKIPAKYPNRINYGFASVLSQIMDEERAVEKLRELRHISTKEEEKGARRRLKLAANWISLYAPEEAKIRLLNAKESEKEKAKLKEGERKALAEFAEFYERNYGREEEQREEIKRICAERGISIKGFFRCAYLAMLGREEGPKLLPFLNALERSAVLGLLK